MASIPLYNTEGQEIGSLPLPDSIFGVEFNEALVHQAIVTEEANYRQGNADTKTRSEVRGGGRKPWRQKGTGRARQGSTRSPQWRHGGVVGGPTPRDYRKAFPVKMRRGAMRCVLSAKAAEGSILGLDSIVLPMVETTHGTSLIKTKTAVTLLKALHLETTRRVLIIIPEYSEPLYKSTRNLKSVTVRFAPNFSVRDALTAHKIVLVKDAVARIEAVWSPERVTETTDAVASEEVAA